MNCFENISHKFVYYLPMFGNEAKCTCVFLYFSPTADRGKQVNTKTDVSRERSKFLDKIKNTSIYLLLAFL